MAENRPYRLRLLPRQTSLSQRSLTGKHSFPECFAFRDLLLEVFMATREQLATALDSTCGWTACANDVNWFYDTNHLFYAFMVCILYTHLEGIE